MGNDAISRQEMGRIGRPINGKVPTAVYMPQGYCPKPWVARVDGEALRTKAGGAKRYATEAAAFAAAKKAAAS